MVVLLTEGFNMLTLNRHGVLCKIAYAWAIRFGPIPEKTNLCSFFWMVVFSLFLVWPLIIATRIFGWIFRIVGAPFALVLCGYRPVGPSWRLFGDNSELPFVPIKHWPKYKSKYAETHIMPIFVIAAPPCILFLGYIAIYEFLWKSVILHGFVGNIYNNHVGRMSFWGVVGLIAAGSIYAVVKNTEVWQMTKAYVKARKKKYCPIIEIK